MSSRHKRDLEMESYFFGSFVVWTHCLAFYIIYQKNSISKSKNKPTKKKEKDDINLKMLK